MRSRYPVQGLADKAVDSRMWVIGQKLKGNGFVIWQLPNIPVFIFTAADIREVPLHISGQTGKASF